MNLSTCVEQKIEGSRVPFKQSSKPNTSNPETVRGLWPSSPGMAFMDGVERTLWDVEHVFCLGWAGGIMVASIFGTAH